MQLNDLQAKSPEEAIIEQISRDFNLAPFMARTQFEQMRQYFERYLGLERDVGQMTFLAVSGDTPPGRPIAECERVPINLTVDGPTIWRRCGTGWRLCGGARSNV